MSLALTTNQTALMATMDAALDTANSAGVTDPGAAVVVPAMPYYASASASTVKVPVRNPFKAALAAFMTAINLPRALPSTIQVTTGSWVFIDGMLTAKAAGYTGTITLARLTPTTGANGSLTIVDGIIIAATNPT